MVPHPGPRGAHGVLRHPHRLQLRVRVQNWSSFKSSIDFIGPGNFVALFSNGSLVNALTVTLVYAVLVAVFQNLFGLALAP
ncbi:hypothetical protein HR12_27920, partial [Microbacterium sp. SUBG005]